MNACDAARALVARAIAEGVFPAASLEVGACAGVLWREALGRLTFDARSAPATSATPFDLASLTKPLATTTLAMELVRTSRLRLDEPVARCFPEWRGTDRDAVTVSDLLEHASGLPARLVDAPPEGRREFEHEICSMPLEYVPRSQSIYSDLGFILLGFLAADRGGASLEDLVESTLRLEPDTTYESPEETLTFRLSAEKRRHAAPTLPLPDDERRGRSLVGEVHDRYAARLGGVAGHAGLFGTAPSVGGFARAVLDAARGSHNLPAPLSPELVARFTARSTVPRSSRALGWDTMLPTSSCGGRLSPAAFGHAGFTGTSLWIDPDRDRYYVLLTNRACGGGTLDQMQGVRRAFHDALADF